MSPEINFLKLKNLLKLFFASFFGKRTARIEIIPTIAIAKRIQIGNCVVADLAANIICNS